VPSHYTLVPVRRFEQEHYIAGSWSVAEGSCHQIKDVDPVLELCERSSYDSGSDETC
jgi:hypothetical protein